MSYEKSTRSSLPHNGPIVPSRAGQVSGMAGAIVRRMEGKKLLCSARQHRLVTDRREEDGGTDAGGTSGELLLMAVGSCATGSARTFLDSHGLACPELAVRVSFQPSETGEGDRICVEVGLPEAVIHSHGPQIETAAKSGAVVARLRMGSELTVRCRPLDTCKAQADPVRRP